MGRMRARDACACDAYNGAILHILHPLGKRKVMGGCWHIRFRAAARIDFFSRVRRGPLSVGP